MKGVRSKALRRLIEIAKANPRSPVEIAEQFGVSLATAYDYYNTLKAIKQILAEEIDDKIEDLRNEIRRLQWEIEEIKAKEREKEIRKLLSGLDEILEERRKRLGY